MNLAPRRIVGGALALSLLLTSCGGSSDTNESTSPATGPAAVAPGAGSDVAEEPIRFLTGDDEELAGTVFGNGTKGIVLAHMRGRDQTTWFEFARAAATDGYLVLTFSFRGYGDSTGQRDSDLDTDLTAAVSVLRGRGATGIVVMGASMGATAAVNVASRLDLAGAVSLSAPADFLGLDALEVAEQVSEPLLLVAAENDQPYADAAVAIAVSAPATQLQIFSGNAHGTNLFGDHQAELTALLLEFAGERLG